MTVLLAVVVALLVIACLVSVGIIHFHWRNRFLAQRAYYDELLKDSVHKNALKDVSWESRRKIAMLQDQNKDLHSQNALLSEQVAQAEERYVALCAEKIIEEWARRS